MLCNAMIWYDNICYSLLLDLNKDHLWLQKSNENLQLRYQNSIVNHEIFNVNICCAIFLNIQYKPSSNFVECSAMISFDNGILMMGFKIIWNDMRFHCYDMRIPCNGMVWNPKWYLIIFYYILCNKYRSFAFVIQMTLQNRIGLRGYYRL